MLNHLGCKRREMENKPIVLNEHMNTCIIKIFSKMGLKQNAFKIDDKKLYKRFNVVVNILYTCQTQMMLICQVFKCYFSLHTMIGNVLLFANHLKELRLTHELKYCQNIGRPIYFSLSTAAFLNWQI